MVHGGKWGVAALLLAVSACSFESSASLAASGSAPGPGETTGEASSTSEGTDTAATSDPSTTNVSTTNASTTNASTTDASTTDASTTTTSGGSDTAVGTSGSDSESDERAQLVVTTDGFGVVQLGGPPETAEVQVQNTGTVAATDLVLDPGPWTIGTQDCETLDPGATCTIELEFIADTLGPREGAITVEYFDGVEKSESSADANADVHGSSANLLTDGAFDDDCTTGALPAGWTNEGPGAWTCEQTSFAGFGPASAPHMLAADNDPADELELGDVLRVERTIDLSDFENAISTGNARILVEGDVASTFDDEQRLEVREDSILFETMFSDTDATWISFSDAEVLGSDAADLTLAFECLYVSGGVCNAYFDNFVVRVEYPVP